MVSKSYAISLLLCFSSLVSAESIASDLCHYDLYRYNVRKRKLEGPSKIRKTRSELSSHEIDQKTGCSICEEDQVQIALYNGVTFKICRAIAHKIEWALNKSLVAGFKIQEATGYFVKQTRGKVDVNGYRTELSNHSFGLSIDINRSHNGLYENCLNFDSRCKLSHGGRWSPDHKLSITSSSLLVELMEQKGFLWGGQIKGKQKDFMHFSPTGF